MTDYHIRAMLRRACADGILTGWQGPHVTGRSYCITPANGHARERALARAGGHGAAVRLARLGVSEPRPSPIPSAHRR